MAISPIVIPLIVAGAMLGSLLVSGKRKISKKKLLEGSLLGGLLNAANAYVVYLLFPPTSYRRFGGGSFSGGSFSGGSSSFTFTGASAYRGAGGATSLTSFLILSFLTGLLIVIVVVGAALVYVRYKGGQMEEETGEPKEEEQEELEESKQDEQEEI